MPSSACKLPIRSEEHTSELQSHSHLVCRLLLEKNESSMNRQDAGAQQGAVACETAGPPRRSPLSALAPRHDTAIDHGPLLLRLFFFFNDTATTEIYTLSLHAALPIYTSELQSHSHLVCRLTGVQTC